MLKFLAGFGHALRGWVAALQGEVNLKVMLAVAVVVVVAGFQRGLGRWQWAAVVLCIGLVLALEMMNSALERLIDVLHPRQDTRIGRVKDILAGAVLLAAVAAAVVGALVFLD